MVSRDTVDYSKATGSGDHARAPFQRTTERAPGPTALPKPKPLPPRDENQTVPLDAPTVTLQREGQPSREIPLLDKETVIGRDPRLVLCVNDVRVSRKHAMFVRAGKRTYLRDLGSRNGVFVNFKKLPANTSHRLYTGDVIVVGETQLVFRAPLISDALEVAEETSEQVALKSPG